MDEEHPTFEILAINPDNFTLRKKSGIWPFPLRDKLNPAIREELTRREKEGWSTLGFAVMDQLGQKGMKLREVLL